jgi:hypothetical protein
LLISRLKLIPLPMTLGQPLWLHPDPSVVDLSTRLLWTNLSSERVFHRVLY